MIFKRNANKVLPESTIKELDEAIFVNPAWPSVKLEFPLTWKEDPFNDNTWCFYYHSLDMVGYLMNLYSQTNEQNYMENAKNLIESWITENPSPEQQASPSAWKDHSTANRVVNIIYFLTYYKDSKYFHPDFEKLIMESLEKHAGFLANDDNYSFSTNHGIFQDRSLLEIAVLFPNMKQSDEWYNTAVRRLTGQIEKSVANSGVHKEHSGAYHIVVMNLFREINEFLIHYSREFEVLSEIIYKMEGVLAHIVKPDGKIPMNGDSGPDVISPLQKLNIRNPYLKYALTKGKEGFKPSENIVFPDGGLAVFRDESYKDLYFMFMAGFHSRTHKHADDLSFVLSVNHTDYFVDSGKYNYKETDEFRQYFRSSQAHNTVTVDRKSYLIGKNQIGKVKIDNYSWNSEYSGVSGVHTLYPGVKMKRVVIYLYKTKTFLIHDLLISNKIRTFSQIFNIGKEVEVIPETKRKILLQNKGEQIELLQINPVTEFKNYKGLINPINGWQSESFNKKHPITQLQFTNKDIGTEFKTVINIEPKNGVKNYVFNENGVYTAILKDNNRFTIKFN